MSRKEPNGYKLREDLTKPQWEILRNRKSRTVSARLRLADQNTSHENILRRNVSTVYSGLEGKTYCKKFPANLTTRAVHSNEYDTYSRFSLVMWSKLKIVTVQWIKSRIWDTIDDWYINNIPKNQVFAVFHSRVICRSVLPKFIELCMETPCLCPPEGQPCLFSHREGLGTSL